MKYTYRKRKPRVYHIGIGKGTACKMENSYYVRAKYQESEEIPAGLKLCSMCEAVTTPKQGC